MQTIVITTLTAEDAGYLHDEILERDYAELEEEYDFLLEDRNALEDENAALRAQNAALRRLLEDALAETINLHHENEELVALNNGLDDEREDLAAELENLLVLHDDALDARDDLQRRYYLSLHVFCNTLVECEYVRYHIEVFRAWLWQYEFHRIQMEAWVDELEDEAWDLLDQRNELLDQREDLWDAIRGERTYVERLEQELEERDELELEGRWAAYWEQRGYMRRV